MLTRNTIIPVATLLLLKLPFFCTKSIILLKDGVNNRLAEKRTGLKMLFAALYHMHIEEEKNEK